ncbi:MAG: tagaturonate reductase [Ileibacterium sp.]|nr:tagaturonate reductase [Ileibacterium sp.]
MKKLSYETLKDMGYEGYLLKDAPEKVLQFGEGNFMRAFVDAFIDEMNEKAGFNGKVVVVQPRGTHGTKIRDQINEQNGLYTLYSQGFTNGQSVREKRVISAISRALNPVADWEEILKCADNPELRFITCNTTEAGISYDPTSQLNDNPPAAFPAKLAAVLYRRWKNGMPGFIVLACELIDDNGKELKRIVLQYADDWGLEDSFKEWVKNENLFCSTLVDRIVTGYPKAQAEEMNAENGYEDELLDSAEVYSIWIIEGPEDLKKELPFEKAGLPIHITDNHKPFKQRKVRILNGAHTSMVLGAWLAGQDIVRDSVKNETIGAFMDHVLSKEVIPTLSLDPSDCTQFASDVADRFKNPYIDHSLLAIALNSTAKWKARVMPSLLGYVEKFNEVPKALAASLAFLIAFYNGEELQEDGIHAHRKVDGKEYVISDDKAVLDFYAAHKNDSAADLAHAVLSNKDFWGQDLTELNGLEEAVVQDLEMIESQGALAVMEAAVK